MNKVEITFMLQNTIESFEIFNSIQPNYPKVM